MSLPNAKMTLPAASLVVAGFVLLVTSAGAQGVEAPVGVPGVPAGYAAVPAVAQPGVEPARRLARPPPAHELGPSARRHTVSVDALRPLLGAFTLELEDAVDLHFAWFLAVSALHVPRTGDELSGFGVEGGLRLYPWGQAPLGLWLGPRLGLGYLSAERGANQAAAPGVSAGAQLGFTWALGDFRLSIAGGVSWVDMEVRVEGVPIGFSGITPDGRLALGWSFGS